MPGMRKKYMLGYAGGGMPTIMMNPDMPVPDMPVMRFQRGGMPRSPLMMQEPFIPQRPPRMFINDDNDLRYIANDGVADMELPPEFMPPPPRKQFLQRPLSIEEERPPMQYIGEDAPRMGMPPEMPQLPGMPSIEQRLPSIEQRLPSIEQRLPSIEQIQRPPSIEQMPQPVEQMPQPIGQEPLPIGQEPQPMMPPTPPRGNSMPPGFIPPPADSLNTMAFVDYYNPTTGETWSAPSGGYTAPPGWELDNRNRFSIEQPMIPPVPETETAPEPMMPPGMEEEMAQPTQDQFMERLMQMIQGLQERRQPAPQPAQQMAPPPPRPPATPFNMGNSGMSGGAPTMPQMFNQGPGFFTPQQSGPKIAPGAIAQQTQELMPNYNLDFSSFLRNR